MTYAGLSPRSLEDDPALHWLRSGGELLLPVKVDITAHGCRLVDSFCWNPFGSMTTFELGGKTMDWRAS